MSGYEALDPVDLAASRSPVPGSADATLVDFLHYGFSPDYRLASAYAQKVVGEAARVDSTSSDPAALLCRIIEEQTCDRGQREVYLPLTAGLDSRGLLGACLRIFPASSIRCLTIGLPESQDVQGAASICRRLGVSHQCVDPSAFVWDLDDLSETAKSVYRRTGTTPPIDGLKIFDELSKNFDSGVPVLSGYFGGTMSGEVLPLDAAARTTREGSVNAVVAMNRTYVLGSEGRGGLQRLLHRFLEEHAGLQEALPGLSNFDLLHIAWRQRLRIRSVTTAAFSTCVMPYEDCRWMKYWLTRPVSARLGQHEFKKVLKGSFPEVFRDLPGIGIMGDASRALEAFSKRTRRFVPWRVRQAMKGRGRRRDEMVLDRGDPRTNSSLAKTLAKTTEAFDARGLVPEVSFHAMYRGLLERPDWEAWSRLRWVMSAEVHDRAGNFSDRIPGSSRE